MNTLLLAAGFLHHLAAAPPLYLIILWTGLGLTSVATLFAMRHWWGRIHPLHRCAALSLLVHLVLASLAMTVRLVSAGDGNGNGSGPPIHVRLVEDSGGGGAALASIIPPQLLATAAAERTPVEVESPNDAKESTASVTEHDKILAVPPTPPVQAPELLPLPVEAKEAGTIAKDAPTPSPVKPPQESATRVDEPKSDVASNLTDALVAAAALSATALPDVDASGVAPVGGAVASAVSGANPYSRRGGTDRLHWAEQGGGGQETEAAVAAALNWLAQVQSSDGRWDASRFGAGREMAVLGQDRGGAGADADTGISALALLAFLGAGNTHRSGDFTSNVRKDLDFLTRGQAADGNLGGEAGLYAHMYCHSMATFALAEAYAMTGDPALKGPVERAVDYSLRAQNPATGGWRYRPGDMGDTSQLGWQLMALWSTERAGMSVPPQTWTGAERFLRSVRRGQSGGLASYRSDSPMSTSMTAEALYCRQLVGESLGGSDNEAAASEAMQQLLRTLPEPSRVNLYYWYYASLALHRQRQLSDQNAAAWQAWNRALTSVLVNKQANDGPDAGSWDPECIWGGYGGRVYSTALSALCLEVYYRYAPLASHAELSASHGGAAGTSR
jgi:hypothetical protein